MKNKIFCFFFSVLAYSSFSQEQLLLQQNIIDDLSTTPIYPRLVEEEAGPTKWKPEYAYLDEIEISTITYLSDGLKVKGLIVKPKKKGEYPCVIYNRGGNRDFGALMLGRIAKEGDVVIASQYRGNAGGEGQEEFGGADHGITEHRKEVDEQVFSWLDRFLRNGEALPNMEYHGR